MFFIIKAENCRLFEPELIEMQRRRKQMTALAASITPTGLRNVRRRAGLSGPVTRLAIPAMSIAA